MTWSFWWPVPIRRPPRISSIEWKLLPVTLEFIRVLGGLYARNRAGLQYIYFLLSHSNDEQTASLLIEHFPQIPRLFVTNGDFYEFFLFGMCGGSLLKSKLCFHIEVYRSKLLLKGTSLVVQWLRLCASHYKRWGSIPSWGTKVPHAAWRGQKIK